MTRIVFADKQQHGPAVRALFLEYWNWGATKAKREYGLEVPVQQIVEGDMLTLDKFMPPKGRLLLAYAEDSPVGTACLRELVGKTGEVERVYVRPDFRGQGLGKALVRKLIDVAIGIGYTRLRLGSAGYMREAHHLYRSMGFTEIEPYEESEVPKEICSHWIFMEKTLRIGSGED